MSSSLFTYTVSSIEEGYSIDTLLRHKLNFSRTLVRRLKTANKIFLDGAPVYANQKVKCGDILTLDLSGPQGEHSLESEKIPLDIIYEDQDILVINKPPAMTMHPTPHHHQGTLANGVIYHWQSQGKLETFRPVSRIDRDTSGLVLIAGNAFAHQQLALQQSDKTMVRHYQALVHGDLEKDRGTIDLPIGRKPGSIVERGVLPEGQAAVTHYEVKERFQGSTFLELWLETGRTHQIRVHLSHLGHPLLGDDLYGGDRELISRQALHSSTLRLIHPRFRELMEFTAPLPEDMAEVVNKLIGNKD